MWTDTPRKNGQQGLSRRRFLQLSSASVGVAFLRCGDKQPQQKPLAIELDDGLIAGHRIYGDLPDFTTAPLRETDILIVGGGVAGLAAAASLQDRDITLCELGQGLGGSAGYGQHAGLQFGQGAHYELEYPSYYGAETLALLEKLAVIRFDNRRDLWTFRDDQYLIAPEDQERTYTNGVYRRSTLPNDEETHFFESLIKPFAGQMPQPVRLLADKHWHLAHQSFLNFILSQGMRPSPTFLQAVDYQMKDDYGDNAAVVSALAGIHYYMCRPYFQKTIRILSPPQGNGYFVQKLAAAVPADNIHQGHLVTRLHPDKDHVTADVLALATGEPQRVRARQVVYAGHKQGLQYVLPNAYAPFKATAYAPWVVVNVVLHQAQLQHQFWQNEVIGNDDRFLGFVNSAAQYQEHPDYTVLTGYYCLPSDQRKSLLDFREQVETWAAATIATMEDVLKQPLRHAVEKVFVKIHGHGMPIPKTDYLLREPLLQSAVDRVWLAGCDTGRLPLCFEALDSGILAANAIRDASD